MISSDRMLLLGSASLPPPGNRLAIFGAGGHGREIAWLAEELWGAQVELTFLVDRQEFLTSAINGIPVECLHDYADRSPETAYVAAIGNPGLRASCAVSCESSGLRPYVLLHPSVTASRWIDLGSGTVVCAGCILTTNIKVGKHVHINIGCTVSHDVVLGDFTTLSPGVHISGNVHVGNHVLIGTGASIINGSSGVPLMIGDNAMIGAGACVTRNVMPDVVVVGVPAKVMRAKNVHVGHEDN